MKLRSIALLLSFCVPLVIMLSLPILPARNTPPATQETIAMVSKDTTTDAGEPIRYLSTPNPEVTAVTLSLPPKGKTDWMTHPVPGYLYVLDGTLTVEFIDGNRVTFKAGQGFLQARTKWHRG